jgi:hypothetical protein
MPEIARARSSMTKAILPFGCAFPPAWRRGFDLPLFRTLPKPLDSARARRQDGGT